MTYKFPKIKKIYIDGKRERKWKYDRKTGTLEFARPIPAGAKMEIYYIKQRKRGWADDGTRTEQAVLPKQAD